MTKFCAISEVRASIEQYWNHDCGGYSISKSDLCKGYRDAELATFDEMVNLLKEAVYQLSVCNPTDAANHAHKIKQFLNEFNCSTQEQ